MRLGLVAMPWLAHNWPCHQNATLAGLLGHRIPNLELHCRNEHVQLWRRMPDEYDLVRGVPWLGEMVYVAHLHPERRAKVREAMQAEHERFWKAKVDEGYVKDAPPLATDVIDRVLANTATHLEEACFEMQNSFDVVSFGASFSYSQLLASIAMAKVLKKAQPSLRVILTGDACRLDPTDLLQAYPFVDHCIVGEQEGQIVELLQGLSPSEERSPAASAVTRGAAQGAGAAVHAAESIPSTTPAVATLDGLPEPNFDAYSETADLSGIVWPIPVEASRGCWWDRRRDPRRPLAACSFCGDSAAVEWRRKSWGRLASEVDSLVTRYKTTVLRFTDKALAPNSGLALASSLAAHGRDYRFGVALRASVSAMELAALWEAGCTTAQVGIEGLSTSYLKRLNKGTTTIQNLAAMRTCFELGIITTSNLLIGFPAATTEEVIETCTNILRFAISYEPLLISTFFVDPGSPLHTHPARFGLTGFRHARVLREVLPERLGEELFLPWLEWTTHPQVIDWTPVIDACKQWRALHRSLREASTFADTPKPLFYFDGGSFLEIVDRRSDFRTVTLSQIERDIYLYCMEIRSRDRITEHFNDRVPEQTILREILTAFVAESLMFEENGKYLSLAVAWRPHIAARRIRKHHEERLRELAGKNESQRMGR